MNELLRRDGSAGHHAPALPGAVCAVRLRGGDTSSPPVTTWLTVAWPPLPGGPRERTVVPGDLRCPPRITPTNTGTSVWVV